jgi:hypothetical protein
LQDGGTPGATDATTGSRQSRSLDLGQRVIVDQTREFGAQTVAGIKSLAGDQLQGPIVV